MANPWTSFLSLLTTKDRWIGKIESISNGKATVSLPVGLGGGSGDPDIIVNATDSYSVGDYVFIESGAVVSQAPDLRAAFRETVY